ncbi:MAG: Efflux ABC transporter, ATP-binding protein, partial [uncultured Blastococcus sp.]
DDARTAGHRGDGAGEVLRRHPRRRGGRPGRSGGLHLRRPRTQRGGEDHGHPDAGHADPARRRHRPGARARHPHRGRRGPQPGQPDRPAGVGRRGPDRPGEPDPAGPAAGAVAVGVAHPRGRAARGVRHQRGGRPPGEALLGGHAPPAGHRGEHRGHAAADVPRRADHRPGPPLTWAGVGDRQGAPGGWDDDPALHPVPGGGRPAGRRHRGDRPRPGDRGGDARSAQGLGRHRWAQGPAAGRRAARRGGRDPGARRGRRRPRRRSGRAVGLLRRCRPSRGRRVRAGPRGAGHRGVLPRSAQPGRGLPGAHRSPGRGVGPDPGGAVVM